MYNVVLDLEMCKVPVLYRNKDYKYALETIQIGAVLLDENFRQVDTFERYVHPEHGVIDNFIKNLTGIVSKNVKDAQPLEVVLREMADWIGDKEYRIYAWSENDFMQLYRELRCKSIHDDKIDKIMYPERWRDYQAVFGERYGYKNCVSLEDALDLCDIDAIGRMHDGLDDAVNTAALVSKLELNPNYELIRQKYVVEESEPIGTCLGDIFACFQLQSA